MKLHVLKEIQRGNNFLLSLKNHDNKKTIFEKFFFNKKINKINVVS